MLAIQKRYNVKGIVIADENDILRIGIDVICKERSDLEIVELAKDAAGLENSLSKLEADIVFLNLHLIKTDCQIFIKRLKSTYPQLRCIVITENLTNSLIIELLKAGVNGFLKRDFTKTNFFESIDTVLNDRLYLISRQVDTSLHINKENSRHGQVEFSIKELQIIKLLCEDKSNKEIASQLNINIRTVESIRIRIIKRINAKSIAGLVAYAFMNNIYTFSDQLLDSIII